MIDWLTEQEFSKKWEEKHKLNKEFMTRAISLNFNYKDIDDFANTEAFIDEIEGIGTGHYWMGEIDGNLFSIEALENNFKSISIYLPKTQELSKGWQFIKICALLFGNCISKITWILSRGGGQHSLFYKESQVTYCLCAAYSELEAESLMKFLQENGNTLMMCVALTDHHFENWSAYCKGETGCYYSLREATERYAVSKRPLSNWRIVSCSSTSIKKWAVWRQDDNGNKFHIQDFEYEVDANFKVLEFEEKGHKQTYWREKI